MTEQGRSEENELAVLHEQCFTTSPTVPAGVCRGLGDLLARYKQHSKARAAWKRGCENGDAGGCWRVALQHHSPARSNKSVLSSDSDEIKSNERAKAAPAEGGAVGTEDVPFPDEKKAAKYAMKACPDDPNAEGEACVAAGQLTGDREWWKRGCGKAKYLPACALFTREKTRHLVAACEQGDTSSCFNLGVLSMSGMMEGEKNPTRAAEYFRRACSKGHGSACYNLAQLYRKQMIGTGRENAKEAAFFFSMACEAGHRDGCFNLGYLFQYGIGCPRDEALAVKVYERACEGTDKPVLDACFNLGVITKQVGYFKRACDLGMREACRYATLADSNADLEPVEGTQEEKKEPQQTTVVEQQQHKKEESHQ